MQVWEWLFSLVIRALTEETKIQPPCTNELFIHNETASIGETEAALHQNIPYPVVSALSWEVTEPCSNSLPSSPGGGENLNWGSPTSQMNTLIIGLKVEGSPTLPQLFCVNSPIGAKSSRGVLIMLTRSGPVGELGRQRSAYLWLDCALLWGLGVRMPGVGLQCMCAETVI